MKYPKKSPYLIYKRIGRDEYRVENYIYSEVYHLSCQTAMFIRRLDGKHNPYELLPDCSKEDVSELMQELKDCNLLAPRKKPLVTGWGCVLYPLVYCYPGKLLKELAVIWNEILMIMFIPMMLIGINLQKRTEHIYMHSKNELYLAIFLGALSGIVLHELSHTFTGLAYGAVLSEIGIGTHCFLPMGYVLMDQSNVKSRYKKIQIFAAGIEMNLFLYGCFMCLAAAGNFNPFIMKSCATINLVTGIVNIFPLNGFDGMKILSLIVGKKDALKSAKMIIRHRNKYLRNKCNVGRIIVVAASYAVVGFQILLPMLVFFEGISLIRLIRL